jgi:hypothetical protein
VLVAAACVFAVGITSTSLDAVETDPGDVINTEWIPTQDNQPTDTGGGDGNSGGGSAGLVEGSEESADVEQTQGSASDETMDVSAGDVESTVKGGGEKALTLWQRLLNLLREYLLYILGGLAAIGALVVGYVVYKRRFAGARNKNPTIIYDVDTSNDVYESWWEMVEMVDADVGRGLADEDVIAHDEGASGKSMALRSPSTARSRLASERPVGFAAAPTTPSRQWMHSRRVSRCDLEAGRLSDAPLSAMQSASVW